MCKPKRSSVAAACTCAGGYLEGAVQSLGLQVPDVNAVIQTAADQELRRRAQTHTRLLFLNGQTEREEG